MYKHVQYSSRLFVSESLLLKIIRVSVPTYRVRGQPAQLECEFELGGDTLYSVKWYRDNEEFYRYLPKYEPPKHAYKLEGIKVDVSIIIGKRNGMLLLFSINQLK